MALDRFARDLAQADALDLGMRAGEIAIDERLAKADGVEDLRAAIRLVGRDAHLGHDLEHRLADRLDVALLHVVGRQVGAEIGQHLLQRLEGEIRVDRLGAVAGERAELMHLVGFAGFDDETDRRAQALLIRWWCTADVASRDGIGIRSGPSARSDRMMML